MEEIRRNTTGGRMTLLVQTFLFEAEYLFNVRADKYANCNTWQFHLDHIELLKYIITYNLKYMIASWYGFCTEKNGLVGIHLHFS